MFVGLKTNCPVQYQGHEGQWVLTEAVAVAAAPLISVGDMVTRGTHALFNSPAHSRRLTRIDSTFLLAFQFVFVYLVE